MDFTFYTAFGKCETTDIVREDKSILFYARFLRHVNLRASNAYGMIIDESTDIASQ